MAKAKRFLLADIDGRSGLLPDALDRLQRLSALLHRRFKFVGDVEVILERRFAASGDEDDLLDAGFDRFFHRILDERLVDHGQHFLRNGLCGWKETGAKATHREYGLATRLEVNELPLVSEPGRQQIGVDHRLDRRARRKSTR